MEIPFVKDAPHGAAQRHPNNDSSSESDRLSGSSVSSQALDGAEDIFRAVLDNMSEGLMLFDRERNLIYQNPASLRIHGFSVQEDGRIDHDALGATWDAWDEAGHPVGFDGWPVSRVFAGEVVKDQVLRVIRRETGFEFHGSYNGAPLYDDAGELRYGFITIRDITEQVRAREAVKRSERRLRAFFESDMMGACYWDVNGQITEANDELLRMVGYTRDDLLAGRLNWARMSPEQYRPRDAYALKELREQGTGISYEKEFIRQDGTTLPVLLGAAMLEDSQHEGVAFVLDITERKATQAALIALNERLREADRRKDEFLAILAHELRNPLAPIRTGVQILTLGADEAQLRSVLPMMERQLRHMTHLLDDLLDVSRITRGKITLRVQPFDLRDAIEAATEASRPLIDQAGHVLDVTLPAGPLPVKGDWVRLAQIFSNLLNNAARYTPRGGRIEIEGVAGEHDVMVLVRDNGIGIEPHDQDRIFELFGQLAHTAGRPGGLGIGLSLVRGLVHLHGGRVTVHSEGSGRGSAFTVVLPRLTGVSLASDAPGESRRRHEPTRFLVVDDNADAAIGLKLLLEVMGHDVRVAHDGPEALTLAATFWPQVVLLDLGMPGMDGYEVCERLRNTETGADARIIAVSGWGQDEDRRKSKAAGFDAHVVKPLSPENIEEITRGTSRRSYLG